MYTTREMLMKKKLIFCALMSISFCLAACGGNNNHGGGGNKDDRSDCTGLIIEKTKTEYNEGEAVAIDDLKVYLTNNDNSKKIEITDYSVSYWQDSTDVGEITNLVAGRYQIWVEAKAYENGPTLSTFEFVYVDAMLKSFKIDTSIGKFTQKAGVDEMMDTWRFNLTYANGWTRQLSMMSYGVSYDSSSYSTLTAGSGSILVTYTEENNDTRSSLVNYTITD